MTDRPESLTPPDSDLPTSREAATTAGTVRYFTGMPCPNGHKVERYTLNGYCVECQRAANRQSRARIRSARGAP